MKTNMLAPVRLVPYRKAWAKSFQKEEKALRAALGSNGVAIEHIGSTAVAGCLAKPEIDIMIGVKTLADADKCIKALEQIGYAYFKKFEAAVPERRYLRKSRGVVPLVHIHAVIAGGDFWRQRIGFRDYLRENSAAVDEYNGIKKQLIASCGGDRRCYSQGKEAFIASISL